MSIDNLLSSVKKNFEKTHKNAKMDLRSVNEVLPPTGMIVDNPLFEYILDRRFMAYGRCYLGYGKKGASKTTFLFDVFKTVIKNGGYAFWIETEQARDDRYLKLQGVDPERVKCQSVGNLEQALGLCLDIAKAVPTDMPDVPICIALDSIAGTATSYQEDQKIIGEQKPGEHARIMSDFYRQLTAKIEPEKVIFFATNQLKEQIGAMSFGAEKPEALIGGEAQRFCSTYQFKFARKKDLTAKNEYGMERKCGSTHILKCTRNKLGREGKGQEIEFDNYIVGGIDWYSPLVRFLGTNFAGAQGIVRKSGGWYQWNVEDCTWNNPETGQEEPIDLQKSFYEADLAKVIYNSPKAKEVIRTAFEIPELPTKEEVEAVEEDNKKKRRRIKKTEEEKAEL